MKTTFRAATSPHHHLQGQRGADDLEGGVDKILLASLRGFRRTGAETASRTGPGAGTEPRTGDPGQGRALGG